MDDVKLSDVVPIIELNNRNILDNHKQEIHELQKLLEATTLSKNDWHKRMMVYKNECESNERKTITDQMIIEFLSKQIPNVDALLFQFMRNEYADLLGATI